MVDHLTDWGNSGEWDPGTVTCTKISVGSVGVGEWRNVLRLLRRNVVVFRLEYADDRRLVFGGQNRGATCTALDDGGTSIVYDSHVEFHRLARLAGPFLTREFERIGDELIVRMTSALDKQR